MLKIVRLKCNQNPFIDTSIAIRVALGHKFYVWLCYWGGSHEGVKYVTADCDLPYMKLSQGSILNPARCKTLTTNTFAYIDLRQSKVLRLRVFLEKAVAIYMPKNLPDFMQPEVWSSCLQNPTRRSHHQPTKPSSNLSHWHIFSYYSPKFTSRIAQTFVAKLQTTGLRSRISIPDKGNRVFSPQRRQHPLKGPPHSPLQWVTNSPFLRIKQRIKVQKQKVLNETCHGIRHVGRPRLRREDNIRRDSSLLLNIRGWRRLAWEEYLEAEILQRPEARRCA